MKTKKIVIITLMLTLLLVSGCIEVDRDFSEQKKTFDKCMLETQRQQEYCECFTDCLFDGKGRHCKKLCRNKFDYKINIITIPYEPEIWEIK